MKMLLAVVFISCTCSIDGKFPAWRKGNADGLFDTIVSKLKRLDAVASRISPLRINGGWSQQGRISQLEILGLDSFSRSGSVTATLLDDKAVVEANVGLWDIRALGFIEFPLFNIRGHFFIREPHIRCRIRLTFAINKIHLNHFEILELRPFEVRDLPGFGSLNWLSRKIAQDKLEKLYPVIRSELERNIEKKLAVHLRSLNLFDAARRLLEASLEEDI